VRPGTWNFICWLEAPHPRRKRKRAYVRVLVYPTAKAMKDACRGLNATNNWELPNTDDWDARFVVFKDAGKKGGELGLVFLTRTHGAGVVAHEMCHVAWAWLTRHRSKLGEPDDERLAYLVQLLVGQYWSQHKRECDWKRPSKASD